MENEEISYENANAYKNDINPFRNDFAPLCKNIVMELSTIQAMIYLARHNDY